MKKIFPIFISLSLAFPVFAEAQTKNRNVRARKSAPIVASSASGFRTTSEHYRSQLSNALRMAQGGQLEAAANALFSLGRRSELSAERAQIKYILGTVLIDLKMYQTAAFQFVDIIRMKHPKYSKQAIEKLSVVADILGDDTILNYAISRVNLNEFPGNLRDMIHFRLGEIKLRNKQYNQAVELFAKVHPTSSYYFQAMYNKGLAELEGHQPDIAIATFNKMISARAKSPVTDTNRVVAQMALARALYQKQDWEASIEAYSLVPRDTLFWHEAVFEQSWAMLRAARFRSALSNFQTLHSAYYEDFYMPESLLLRAIVYLYICKYDEMEKVLSLFEKTYGPVRGKISEFIKSYDDPAVYYNEVEKASQMKGTEKSISMRLPFIVSRYLLDQGNIKRSFGYVEKLNQEKARVDSNPSFRASSLGQYSLKILANRSKNAKVAIGDMAKAHLLNMRVELRDLYEQAGFIRYEMITGKKEVVKKKIAGKDLVVDQVDDKMDREFYVQNGYEYYPFQGEFWLDEVGNYHYLGKQSCE